MAHSLVLIDEFGATTYEGDGAAILLAALHHWLDIADKNNLALAHTSHQQTSDRNHLSGADRTGSVADRNQMPGADKSERVADEHQLEMKGKNHLTTAIRIHRSTGGSYRQTLRNKNW